MKKVAITVSAHMNQQKEQVEKEDYAADTILESMQQLRINTALQEMLRHSETYQELQNRSVRKIQRIHTIGLSHAQWREVEHLLTTYNEESVLYGELAYAQGFQDAVTLQKELSKL